MLCRVRQGGGGTRQGKGREGVSPQVNCTRWWLPPLDPTLRLKPSSLAKGCSTHLWKNSQWQGNKPVARPNNQCQGIAGNRSFPGRRQTSPFFQGVISSCLAAKECRGSCLATTVPAATRQLRIGLPGSVEQFFLLPLLDVHASVKFYNG